MKIGGTQYRDGAAIIKPHGREQLQRRQPGAAPRRVPRLPAESAVVVVARGLKAQAAAARGYALTKYRQRAARHLRLPRLRHDGRPGLRRLPDLGQPPYWTNWKNAVRATGSATTGYVAKPAARSSRPSTPRPPAAAPRTTRTSGVARPLPYLRGSSDPLEPRDQQPGRAPGARRQRAVDGQRLRAVRRRPSRPPRPHQPTAGSRGRRDLLGRRDVAPSPATSFRTIVASGSPFSSRVNSTMIRHLTQRLRRRRPLRRRPPPSPGPSPLVPARSSSPAARTPTCPTPRWPGPSRPRVNAPLLLSSARGLPAATGDRAEPPGQRGQDGVRHRQRGRGERRRRGRSCASAA